MKRIMTKTTQFGGGHYKQGETVYARKIRGIGNRYILSKRKQQPVGPTVDGTFLAEITALVPDEA